MIGCKAAAGVSVTEISRDLQARREWVYQQKGCVQPDIFHELRPIGAEAARPGTEGGKADIGEAGLEKRACGKRPAKRRWNSRTRYMEKWNWPSRNILKENML